MATDRPTTLIQRLMQLKVVRAGLLPSLFFAATAVAAYLRSVDFTLNSLKGRQLGIASGHLVDVAARAGVHWKCIGLGLLAMAVTMAALHWIGTFRHPSNRPEARMVLALSVTGLASVVILPWQLDGWNMVLFHAGLLLWLSLGGALKRLLLPSAVGRKVFNEALYIPILLISLGAGSLAMILLGMWDGVNHLIIMAIAPWLGLAIALAAIVWRGRSDDPGAISQKAIRLLWILAPLISLPAFPRLADELFFDLNKNGFYYLGVPHTLGVLLGTLMLWMALRPVIFRGRMMRLGRQPDGLLTQAIYPRALFALIIMPCLPGFVGVGSDYFETASNCLPVTQFYQFGRIPILDLLPPHLASDFAGGFIHSLLTGGPEGNDFLAFNNLCFYAIAALGIYHGLWKVVGSPHLALVATALLPLAVEILPQHFSVGALGIASLAFWLKPGAGVRDYFLSLGMMLVLIFYRLDVGYPVLLSAIAVIVVDQLAIRSFRIRWKPLAIAAGIWAGIGGAVLLLVSLLTDVNPLHNAMLALGYFVSEQSYGYENLGDTQLLAYNLQYIVFLGVALALVVYMALHASADRGHRIWLATLFFLFLFMFNFQRGLVRHNLREEWDVLMHSTAYIGYAGFALWLARRQPIQIRWSLFASVGFVVCLVTKYPVSGVTGGVSLAERLRLELKGYVPPTATGAYVSRMGVASVEELPSAAPIVSLIRSETSANQTFLDLSNQPMLYHYSRREIPSYFAQIPAMIHNDVLQKDFIEGLDAYDMPIAILWGPTSRALTSGLDGVDNRWRHYRIAEYIYTRYEPWGMVENDFIWKKKGYKSQTRIPDSDLYKGSINYEDIWAGFMPNLWAETDESYLSIPAGKELLQVQDSIYHSTPHVSYLRLPASIDKSQGNYIELEVVSTMPGSTSGRLILVNETTHQDLGEVMFNIPPREGPSRHAIRVSALVTWHYPGTGLLRVELPKLNEEGEASLVRASIKKGD